jgi:hypothetical protein
VDQDPKFVEIILRDDCGGRATWNRLAEESLELFKI